MKKLSGEVEIPPHFFRHRGPRSSSSPASSRPIREDRDPTPGTWNSRRCGRQSRIPAPWQLGYDEAPLGAPRIELSAIDAAHATLVVASLRPPFAALTDKTASSLSSDFLHHGGRIVATGATATIFLPVRKAAPADRIYTDFLKPQPEGPGPLARAGEPRKWLHRFAGAGDGSLRSRRANL